jgi:hypothetical protein
VNPAPLGTDDTCQFVEEWREYENVEYLDYTDLNLVLDFSVFL